MTVQATHPGSVLHAGTPDHPATLTEAVREVRGLLVDAVATGKNEKTARARARAFHEATAYATALRAFAHIRDVPSITGVHGRFSPTEIQTARTWLRADADLLLGPASGEPRAS